MAEKKEKNSKGKNETKERQEPLPPLDFSSLILPFYTQALIKLGQVKDPITNKEEENLDLAKRFIDLLDILKKKTEGNLASEEEKFLSSCLNQLKITYMEKAKIIKL